MELLLAMEEGEVKLSEQHDAFRWINADEESLDLIYPIFKVKMVNWNWD